MICGSANSELTARSVAIRRPWRSTMSGLAHVLAHVLGVVSATVTRSRGPLCSARRMSWAATAAKARSRAVSASSARTRGPSAT